MWLLLYELVVVLVLIPLTLSRYLLRAVFGKQNYFYGIGERIGFVWPATPQWAKRRPPYLDTCGLGWGDQNGPAVI